ncbi:translocation/assembly module TamB domain-containing protein [Marivirga arenosa]|uniref:Translocation/assembly module TamB domain-containing protein n=1 Tax=Marivirga arenosa TaxID=3059076 RepID=A0AA52F003_9BACT|nr:translocation/assembly module TamB domain-containing protein [Marivirga sp. BKB1-2]WNB17903.1 translocation/assembly module TamB domain-containing protein [Marivirga sp. BKB1-2]
MKRTAKIISYIVASIVLLFVVFIFSLRIPSVQQKITNYATNYVSDKTHTKFEINKLYITFLGAAQIEGIYVEDQRNDTLLYAKSILVDLAWKPLIDGNIYVKSLELDGLTARVYNQLPDSSFNYQFIIEAFSSEQNTKQNEKSENTSPTSIIVDNITLNNIDLGYKNIAVGLKTYLKLKKLKLAFSDFNLDSMEFNVDNFVISGLNGGYSQVKPFSESVNDTSEVILPKIKLSTLNFRDINLRYNTAFDSLNINSFINFIKLENAQLNLKTNSLSIGSFDNQIDHFHMTLGQTNDSSSSEKNKAPSKFEFPDYQFQFDKFNFNLADLIIKSFPNSQPSPYFNPDYLAYQNIGFHIDEGRYKPNNINISSFQFNAKDQDQFQLKTLSGGIILDNNTISISDINLETNHSILQSNLKVKYNSIDSLIKGSFHKTDFNLKVQLPTSLNIRDAYYFSPDLAKDSTIIALSKSPIKIYGGIKGNENSLDVEQLHLLYGKESSLSIKSEINNWQNVENLSASIQNLNLNTSISDFNDLIPFKYPDHYPKKVELNAKGNYKNGIISTDLIAFLDKKSSIDIKGNYNTNTPSDYKAQIKLSKLELGKWLQDTVKFNTADIDLKVEGEGLIPKDMNTNLNMAINNFSYLSNQMESISLNASLIKNEFILNTDYSDAIADLSFKTTGYIDTVKQKLNINADIKKLDLFAFGIADSAVFAATKTDINIELDSAYQLITGNITDTKITSTNQSYSFPPLLFETNNSTINSYAYLSLDESFIDIKLNHSFQELSNYNLEASKLQKAKIFEVDNTENPMDLSFNLNLKDNQSISSLLPADVNFKPVVGKGKYNSENELIDFNLSIEKFHYGNIDLDSLSIKLDNSADEFHINTNFKRINSGDISIFPTQLSTDITPEKAFFNLFMQDEMADSLFSVNAVALRKTDSLFWSIKNENLILNAEKWKIHPENEIYFDASSVKIQNLIFERNKQYFELKTTINNAITSLNLDFENFRIENIFAIINAEESPVNGILDGDIHLNNLKDLNSFTSDLKIDSLKIYNTAVGVLNVNAQQNKENRYQFNVNSVGEVSLRSEGWLDLNDELPTFDIKLDMDSVSLPFLASFSEGLIRETSGNLIGKFNIKGNTENFDYSGNLKFESASLFFPYLNMAYELPDEEINLKNEKIVLNNFTILDQQKNKLVLNGRFTTKNIFNPTFDLKLKAENFQLLNTTQKESDLFYGQAFFNADLNWVGSLNQSKLQANIGLNEKTDLVYIIPESEIDIIEQKGIVRFKKAYQASDTLKSESEELSRNSDIEGLDINAFITTDKNAKFKVIVDQQRGDYLTVSGDTDLNFSMRKNGAISLNGNVEVDNGYYQLSLYDLVKRRFDIESGSRISWSGDPYEASLDLTAIYKTETAVNTLMEDQISSASSQIKTQYKQRLPFLVQLFVDGNLTKPEISFGLDMPQNSKGALGGNVYQQIQFINADENRLNKQVFSLLVLNQFFPTGSSSNGTNSEAIARSSASQILSNQLNKLSNQYVKGVNLNLDLNSYEDYQSGSAQDRTQLDLSLSKNLFNNRFRVEVGSQVDLEGQQRTNQQATDIIGNILVEYLLTEDGRYRLKGYRKNEFEGLIEGKVTITGISIQFSKEFEKFNELWQSNSEEDN